MECGQQIAPKVNVGAFSKGFEGFRAASVRQSRLKNRGGIGGDVLEYDYARHVRRVARRVTYASVAFAAFFAISDRFFGLRLAARAGPPFTLPRRPSATAAGFFSRTGSGFGTGSGPRCLVAKSTTRRAA